MPRLEVVRVTWREKWGWKLRLQVLSFQYFAASTWAGRKFWLRQPNFSVCLETPCPEKKEDLGKAPSLPLLCISVGSELNLSSLSCTHLLPFLPQPHSPSPFPRCPFARCLPRRPRLAPTEPRGLILGLFFTFLPSAMAEAGCSHARTAPGCRRDDARPYFLLPQRAFKTTPGLKKRRVQLGEAAREQKVIFGALGGPCPSRGVGWCFLPAFSPLINNAKRARKGRALFAHGCFPLRAALGGGCGQTHGHPEAPEMGQSAPWSNAVS